MIGDLVERVAEETSKRNPLDALWACLACWWKGRMGDLRHIGTAPVASSLRCPSCGSDDLAPADGSVHDLPAYHGPIGTRH